MSLSLEGQTSKCPLSLSVSFEGQNEGQID
nr:MAG TPA: hypothetical protein [Caudoviricetes sp.]